MTNVKILRKKKGIVFCAAPSYRAVTPELAESLLRDGAKAVNIKFPLLNKLPQDGLQFAALAQKYRTGIWFRAEPGKVKELGKPPAKPKIRLVIPASFDEFVRENRATRMRYFAKPYPQHVTPGDMRMLLHSPFKFLKKADAVLLLRGGKVAGMFIVMPGKTSDGEPYMLLAWSCISPELTKAERRDAHYQASRWLKKMGAALPLYAAIHAFNVRSQKFHFKLGLRPEKVVIRQRRATRGKRK
jgi:hypothetical protein